MAFGLGTDNAWADYAEAVTAADLEMAGASTPSRLVLRPVSARPTQQLTAMQALVSRCLDVVLALALLVVALPALLLVAIALQIDNPGRLFFVQRRLGKGGVVFPCLKFRTMCENADAVLAAHLAANPAARAEWEADFKLKDDPRVTRFSALVRKFSIDEFPQLINILRGEMTIVGPRPIVPAEIERYGSCYVDYCAVKPGLTGLWQVSGRNNVSYAQRVALDRFYVRHKTILLDLKILLMTVPAVFGARGSY